MDGSEIIPRVRNNVKKEKKKVFDLTTRFSSREIYTFCLWFTLFKEIITMKVVNRRIADLQRFLFIYVA